MSDKDDQQDDLDADAGTNSADDDKQDDGQDGDGADQLGDAGKKALDSMKAKWQKERDARKALEAQIAAGSKKDDDATDPAELRKQIQAEARAEVLKDRALDKVEAKAAKLFADPEDARALLAGRVDDFVDDGKVDVESIEDALADLLKKKPHLAAATAKRFQGGADGGARKGSKPDQLTRDDLKKMTPEQIVKAQDEGRLNELMGVD